MYYLHESFENVQRKNVFVFAFLILFLLTIALLIKPSSYLAAKTSKSSTSPNLINNPTFDTNISGWYRFNPGIKQDTGIYRGSSGASIYFPPNTTSNTITWISRINVVPNHFYTFRAYFRSHNVPSAPKFTIYSYNSSGSRIRYQEGWFSVSKSDTWQEATMEYRALSNASSVQLYIGNSSDTKYELWLDDIYFGLGKAVLQQPPSQKRAFEGSTIKVDSSGNFEVNKGGAFKPFFPLALMNNSLVTSSYAQKLSNQGFNFAFGSSTSALANLKGAKSQYNPDGMMMMASIIYQTGYDSAGITSAVNTLKGSSASDAILGYYYEPTDGSQTLASYPQIKSAYDAFKSADSASPVIWNVGEIGYGRALDDVGDLTGLFRYPQYKDMNSTKHIPVNELGSSFKIASNLEGVTRPNAIATIAATDAQGVFRPTPAQLRALVYHAIWGGAKGIIFWQEKQADGSNIDATSLWPLFPVLRKEIETILPVIRQGSPNFSVSIQTKESNKRVDVLAKQYNSDPYLIVVNTEESTVNTTFILNGLSFQPVKANEIFGQGSINFSTYSFSTSLPPYATRVYKLTR